jgi:O-succinylbenzoate synthase
MAWVSEYIDAHHIRNEPACAGVAIVIARAMTVMLELAKNKLNAAGIKVQVCSGDGNNFILHLRELQHP